jgi:hypothetical protein
MKRLAEIFADEGNELESQWDKGETFRRKICEGVAEIPTIFQPLIVGLTRVDLDKLAARTVRRVQKSVNIFVGTRGIALWSQTASARSSPHKSAHIYLFGR